MTSVCSGMRILAFSPHACKGAAYYKRMHIRYAIERCADMALPRRGRGAIAHRCLADAMGTSARMALRASLTWLPRSISFFTVMPPRPFSLPTGSVRLGMSALLAVRVRCVATWRCRAHRSAQDQHGGPGGFCIRPFTLLACLHRPPCH